MIHWTKRRQLPPLTTLILLALVLATGCQPTDRAADRALDRPREVSFLGWTREQIIDCLGEPDDRWPGYYGNPPLEWAKQHEPCETLTYVKPNGTLYISLYQEDGRWVCCASDWLPKGWRF